MTTTNISLTYKLAQRNIMKCFYERHWSKSFAMLMTYHKKRSCCVTRAVCRSIPSIPYSRNVYRLKWPKNEDLEAALHRDDLFITHETFHLSFTHSHSEHAHTSTSHMQSNLSMYLNKPICICSPNRRS